MHLPKAIDVVAFLEPRQARLVETVLNTVPRTHIVLVEEPPAGEVVSTVQEGLGHSLAADLARDHARYGNLLVGGARGPRPLQFEP